MASRGRRGSPDWKPWSLAELDPFQGHLSDRAARVFGRNEERISLIGSAPMLTKAFLAWQSMHIRCTNSAIPAYRLYGGRGVRVADRRRDFLPFLCDVGQPRHRHLSLDRIDNGGGYQPRNCRWATAKTQSRNRRPWLRGVKKDTAMSFGVVNVSNVD